MVVFWGWVCALAGSVASVPQVLRLVRSGRDEGVSLLMWQLLLGAGIGWTSHGILVGHLNIVVPNVMSAALAASVLLMLQRNRRVRPFDVWPLALAVGAAMVAIEHLGSSALFGVAAIVPVAVGMLGQTRDLMRAPDIAGISGVYIIGACVMQAMWLSWAFLVGDVSTQICSSVIGLVAALNGGLWLLRTRRTVVIQPTPLQDMAA